MTHTSASIRAPDRRRFLLYAGTAIGVAGLGPPRLALAQGATDLDDFLALSARVTGHDRLDAMFAEALLGALRNSGAYDAIASLSPDQDSPERRALLKGWYLGRVAPNGVPDEDTQELERAQGEEPDGDEDDVNEDIVVGYEATLMGVVVADLIPLRSYCGGRPHFWADPPEDPDVQEDG